MKRSAKKPPKLMPQQVAEARTLLDELSGVRIFAMTVQRTPSERFHLTVELYQDRAHQMIFKHPVRLPETADCESLREPLLQLVAKRERAIILRLRKLGVSHRQT